VATVIVLPALLLAFWLVLQYAVAAHVRNVAQAAAQDAALAAASGGDSGVGASLIAGSAGRLAAGVSVATSRSASEVTVTVDVGVLQVFPIGDFDVSVTASAPVERFIPQPERP
jgi:Flp pilus assembly protein TadG